MTWSIRDVVAPYARRFLRKNSPQNLDFPTTTNGCSKIGEYLTNGFNLHLPIYENSERVFLPSDFLCSTGRVEEAVKIEDDDNIISHMERLKENRSASEPFNEIRSEDLDAVEVSMDVDNEGEPFKAADQLAELLPVEIDEKEIGFLTGNEICYKCEPELKFSGYRSSLRADGRFPKSTHVR